MKQPSLVELAKQSDPYAIATLLNRALHPRGILAKVALMDTCLHVLVEAAQVPSQDLVVSQIRQGVLRLEPDAITSATIYGRRTGQGEPAWTHQLQFTPEVENPWVEDDEQSVEPPVADLSEEIAAPGATNPTPSQIADNGSVLSPDSWRAAQRRSSQALSVERIDTALISVPTSVSDNANETLGRLRPWYEWDIAIAAMLIVFFPAGLYLMWRYARWPAWVKWPITLLWTGLIIASMTTTSDSTSSQKPFPKYAPGRAALPQIASSNLPQM